MAIVSLLKKGSYQAAGFLQHHLTCAKEHLIYLFSELNS